MKMNDYKRKWDNRKRRWIYEHREIMQNFVGRELLSSEHIHHKDGNPRNNNIENLEITDAETHIVKHHPKANYKPIICSVKDCNIVQHAKGLCKKHYMKNLRQRVNQSSIL